MKFLWTFALFAGSAVVSGTPYEYFASSPPSMSKPSVSTEAVFGESTAAPAIPISTEIPAVPAVPAPSSDSSSAAYIASFPPSTAPAAPSPAPDVQTMLASETPSASQELVVIEFVTVATEQPTAVVPAVPAATEASSADETIVETVICSEESVYPNSIPSAPAPTPPAPMFTATMPAASAPIEPAPWPVEEIVEIVVDSLSEPCSEEKTPATPAPWIPIPSEPMPPAPIPAPSPTSSSIEVSAETPIDTALIPCPEDGAKSSDSFTVLLPPAQPTQIEPAPAEPVVDGLDTQTSILEVPTAVVDVTTEIVVTDVAPASTTPSYASPQAPWTVATTPGPAFPAAPPAPTEDSTQPSLSSSSSSSSSGCEVLDLSWPECTCILSGCRPGLALFCGNSCRLYTPLSK
ncbi:hypothetical protein GGI25_004589 [Coemansia spiralis]|uniref:Uncharacterized protein n=1 Tax=Coemansia spiralis TaxID=417178 RepID=A0A9W8G4U6_9FUNG|nr:hypothetical protein GGI25_004589 [Coemansia spiralis]